MFDIQKEFGGLTEREAKERLQKSGYNELPAGRGRNSRQIIIDILKEPMLFLLVAGGIVYLLLGDPGEALMLLSFVFIVIGITFYQEHKTERSLTALRNLSSPQALVIRGGEQQTIPGREVVAGDLIIIKEGDRIPADALFLSGNNLIVDESLLTGESAPVAKEPAGQKEIAFARPGGEHTPFLFSGSLVVDGQAVARVETTGVRTEIGKIGKALETIESRETRLQIEVKKIVKIFFAIALVLVAAVILISGLYRGAWLSGMLSGITLAMAILPEEFPVVLTIFLAVGAWRLSQIKVLARKITAVETLGSASVLCVDKTGTLTINEMTVKKLLCGETETEAVEMSKISVSPASRELAEYAALACRQITFDPMEKAIKKIAALLPGGETTHENWTFEREYSLSKKLLAFSNIWHNPNADHYIIATKGAPEAIIDLCHMDAPEKLKIENGVERLARLGLRVLGVAKASFNGKNFYDSQHDYRFQFLGLVGLDDPVRVTAKEAVAECAGAGIRVIMITGDYPVTARQIADQVGLDPAGEIVTGSELTAMAADELKQKIKTANIFARMIPEQKLLIIDALKAADEIVAMTGDGVNDAPALKAADIGVAMGEKGTDVAREAADLVLLKNDFSHLVAAIRLGRKIFDNLKKAMAYTVSVHVPIAGASLVPLLFGWPSILFPVHIVFLELIIDPTCSIVFESEPEEKNIMKRPPRSPNLPLFSKRMLLVSILQGLFSLMLVLLVFFFALKFKLSEAEARTLSFAMLVLTNLSLILANRSWSSHLLGAVSLKNKALNWILLGTVTFLLLTVYHPWLQKIFSFAPLHPGDLLIALGLSFLSILWFEFVKALFPKKLHS
jgi:Ca2+-transporting ATPase